MKEIHREIAHEVARAEDRIIEEALERAIDEVARRYGMSPSAVSDIYGAVMRRPR